MIGVVGTVASAGAGLYSSMQQQKAAKKAASAGGGGGSTSGINFGQKPQAARYKPVDFTKEQYRAIMGNISNLRPINQLVTAGNDIIDRDALKRARQFIPNYEQNMAIMGNNANDFLQGRLPYDDVLGIVSDRNEIGGALGIPGASSPATLRDLGIQRTQAMQLGGGMMKDIVGLAEQVNPVSRRARPQEFYVSPLDRIKLAMEQNQLIQQSDQNFFNLEAGLSPSESAQSQIALQRALSGGGGGGGGGGQDIGQYAQAATSVLGALGGLFQDKGGGAAGAGLSSLGRDSMGTTMYGYKAPAAAASAGNVINASFRPSGFSLAA